MRISYDSYSLKIDGKRIFLYSGEIHPYRLPSPSLWRDVLEKIKAAGFNGISVYFDRGYHSPSPGKYDFTGIRNMDLFLDLANEIGLYVIARPGPYINAEADGGGFPAWMVSQPGNFRSTDPLYLKWAYEWMSHIDAVLARHQLTNGTGTVIAYQVENEIYDPTLEVFAPESVDRVVWNGLPVNAHRTLAAQLNGPAAVHLPELADWKFQFEPFERRKRKRGRQQRRDRKSDAV